MDGEGVVNLDGRGLSQSVRKVVVADQEKHLDSRIGKPSYSLGKLPLLSLLGLPALEGVTCKDHQINAVGQGIFHQLVESGQEVTHASGEASCRVQPAIILDAYVEV